MTELESLTKKVINFRKKRKWIKGRQVSPKNMAISMLLEAAEFLELFQYTSTHKLPKAKKQQIEDELVDVLYWVLAIAYDFRIDLEKAFDHKMKKNKLKYPLKK